MASWIRRDDAGLMASTLSDMFPQRLPWPGIPLWRKTLDPSCRESWVLLSVMIVCGVSSFIYVMKRRRTDGNDSRTKSKTDARSTDPPLLKKHSTFESYTTKSSSTGASLTYPSIRTFFHPHPQAAKLPTSPTPIPLLVFVHGLGGSVAQFHPILTSLVNVAPCLAIDLPGCGTSAFSPTDWNAYTVENMAALLATVIDQYRDKELGQKVVLIGHSMGCSLSALLISSSSPIPEAKLVAKHSLGLVAICPRAEPPNKKEAAALKSLVRIPGPIFDLLRLLDRRGGAESASVARHVGPGAEDKVKELQLRLNEQSKTPVWRRMAQGILPHHSLDGKRGGLPGLQIWRGISVPVMLVAGESDKVTPATELAKIAQFLGKTSHKDPSEDMKMSELIVDDAALVDSDAVDRPPRSDSATTPSIVTANGKWAVHAAALKTVILPAPAAHALLYAPSTARIVAGLIQSFLSSDVDARLSLGWQLQYLTTEGKWDVKNLAKWQKVKAVGDPIPGPAPLPTRVRAHSTNGLDSITQAPGPRRVLPVFRAMKTLREVDEVHSPAVFVKNWAGRIKAVIDISHESPVYDPQGLERGGIQYHKLPTVSKLPPTAEEVQSFIALVDRLRAELGIGGPVDTNSVGSVVAADADTETKAEDAPVIGIHCHYGYNRTGMFLVAYMHERLGFSLQEALDEFERRRPPGIRHGHFIDSLFVRYCVGLKAPTL